jgi:tetratricopeptide (TPR) repeat protein
MQKLHEMECSESDSKEFFAPGRRRMRAIFHIFSVVAVVAALAVSATEAKPRQSPDEKSPAEALLKEARALSLKGDLDAAYQKLDVALQADPKFWQAIYFRAELHFRQHRYESTVQDCTEILQMKPDQVVAALLRAQANSKLGRNDECLRELDHVISHGNKKDIVPLVTAYEMRAWLRATSSDTNVRNGKQALSDAKQACKLSHNNDPQSLDTLAAANAEVGDFQAAVDAEDRAINAQLVSDEFNIPTENIFQKHRASFQQHQPIRDE